MPLHRLTSTDAFLVVDVPGAPSAVGIVRCARKILVDGAELLARSVTYTAASFDIVASGASAGINAEGDARDAAIAAFAGEVGGLVPDTALELTAGKGVAADELAGLGTPAMDPALRDRLVAVGAVAAAERALGSLDGVSVAVDDVAGVGPAVIELVGSAGARLVEGDPAAGRPARGPEADVWFVGSKVGVIDHDVAAQLRNRLIVPIGALPVTARGLAVARRNGIVVLPDFVTCAGPVLAALAPPDVATPPDDDVARRIRDQIDAVIDHEHGPLLGACFAAEVFLATWTDELPFGRPLA